MSNPYVYTVAYYWLKSTPPASRGGRAVDLTDKSMSSTTRGREGCCKSIDSQFISVDTIRPMTWNNKMIIRPLATGGGEVTWQSGPTAGRDGQRVNGPHSHCTWGMGDTFTATRVCVRIAACACVRNGYRLGENAKGVCVFTPLQEYLTRCCPS